MTEPLSCVCGCPPIRGCDTEKDQYYFGCKACFQSVALDWVDGKNRSEMKELTALAWNKYIRDLHSQQETD